MANTKKWVIAALDCKPSVDGLTNVVSTVHWRKQATEVVGDVTYMADMYGACAVPPAESETFVAFESLTEEIVINWIESVLDTETIDTALDIQIETKKTPPIVQKMAPWMETPHTEVSAAE